MNKYNIGDVLRVTRPGEYFGVEFIVDYIDNCDGLIRYSNEVQFDGYVFAENEVELCGKKKVNVFENKNKEEEDNHLIDILMYLVEVQKKLIEKIEK